MKRDFKKNVMKSEDWAELLDMFYNNKKFKQMRIGKGQPAEPFTVKSAQVIIEIEQVK